MMAAINGQSRKKNNMSNGQSRKKQNKINGHSRKKTSKINGHSCKKTSKINGQSRCSWQTPPDDIMEYILQRLSLWDRIQLRMVSKSWRSVATRRDIRSSPTEMPWLLLPPSESPNLSNNNYISFFSLSDAKVHKLTLPRAFGGGWVHGSSKGWLVMVKGAYSKMFLLNPISGAQQELPSLKTVFPYIGILKELKGELEGTHVLDSVCNQVVLSTSDIYSDDCIVAAIFRDHILALCRPGDKRWRKVLEFEESDRPKLSEILFSCGMLYALVDRDGNNELVIAARTEIFGGHKLAVKFVYDRYPPRLHTVDWQCQSHLLESTSKNEVLLIHQIQNIYGEIISFIVYKLDGETENFHEVKHLGEQIIFLSDFGSSSLSSAALEGNCIYFATNAFNNQQSNLATGIFYLSSGRIKQKIPCVDRSVLLRLGSSVARDHGTCWFTPSL